MNQSRNGRRMAAWLAFAITIAVLASASTAFKGPQENQLQSYADVAEVAMPSVVNISADKMVEQNFQHPFMRDPFFRRFFEMPDDETHRGNERVSRSLGSGVLISSDGYIITNNHVVQGAEKIRVVFHEEREYTAEIIGTDPSTDIALIKIEADDLPAIAMSDSDLLRVGDQVMAIGNPFGVGQTVTMGIVSAIGRTIGLIDYEDLIQTDASINPGNSGGALVDMQGRLVGMNAAILSRSGGSQGVGFAIPAKMINRIVESLKADGEVHRAYLGVLPQEVTQAMADYYQMERPRGVLVAQVNDDTPAQKAGLNEGDIILSVDGKEIKNPSTLRNVISLSEVGHKAQLKVLRDGKVKDFTVRLEKFPEADLIADQVSPEGDQEDETLDGVSVTELTNRMRAMGRLAEDLNGLLVTSVQPTSNAARAGLTKGDVIQEIGDREVSTLKEFKQALGRDKDRPIWMRVFKPAQDRSIFLAVER
ncbi:MAG: DegQ family serine endoprotease [Gemmatimonadales bacterium]|nr:DegQ family serine endoprotease [Gemmatimonadales bacterium]